MRLTMFFGSIALGAGLLALPAAASAQAAPGTLTLD
jgi:hypothetical protein